MTKKTPRVSSLALYTGYVESQSIACLVLTHYRGFESVQEALMSLHKAFALSISEDTISAYVPQCCKKAQATGLDFKFCPSCGNALEQPVPTVDERFHEFFSGITDGTHSVWEALQSEGWETGIGPHIPPDWKNMVVIDGSEAMLDASQHWSYERYIEDGDNHESDESHVASHITFMNEAMSEMIFKRS